MPLSYVIRNDAPTPDNDEKDYVQITHQIGLVRNIFTRDSSKVFDIIKDLTLGTDAKT